ncbi:hypothetical protein E4U13_007430 [Claviceps humidiphila]|uniref:eRF1 domain-containing protein n=1 Tax=Claviceps humidiphila TaxID=1294629 RepID=A0A9P7Q5S0_9HYPO|nr:hypothetical protein E4U13_007430 [Claviceps humidiphila]
MTKFLDLLKLDDVRAWYGSTAVERAIEDGAIGLDGGVLLINNSLFRSQDLETRKKTLKMMGDIVCV